MTAQEAVKMVDPTAKFYEWGSTLPCNGNTHSGWVNGNGWETKITFSEDRAWELAVEQIKDYDQPTIAKDFPGWVTD